MKKSLLTIVALGAMLGSCSNDETLDMTARQAITFDDVFVENSTRAIDNSYTSAGLSQFEVYGTITNSSNQTANLFSGVEVSKGDNDEWSYTDTQYWIPGNTYNFTAIADGNIKGVTQVDTDTYGMPTKIHLKDASRQTDILYAQSSSIRYNSGDGAKTVAFTFSHLLAKAKFTVKNEITNSNGGYTYRVSDVRITNASAYATYTIDSTPAWSDHGGNYQLNFGNIAAASIGVLGKPNTGADATHIVAGNSAESNFERLLIPFENKVISISFTSELYKDKFLVQREQKEFTTNQITLAAGNAYNFVIKLGNPGAPIQFTVEKINDWNKDINGDGETNDNVNVNN